MNSVCDRSYNAQPVYNLTNVTKKREKGGNLFELAINSFDIKEGEFVALVGESGCGKSTLLDMLGLVLRPTSAEIFTIRIKGKEVICHVMGSTEYELAEVRKTYLGYVLQTGGLLPFLTVYENIQLPCLINDSSGNSEEHIHYLVKKLKIVDQLNKKPQFLSGGQRQRAAIARALAHRPSIVLADEPTAAVDKITAIEIIEEFKELTREIGVTFIMVTHNINLVKNVIDRQFTFEVQKVSQYNTRSFCVEK